MNERHKLLIGALLYAHGRYQRAAYVYRLLATQAADPGVQKVLSLLAEQAARKADNYAWRLGRLGVFTFQEGMGAGVRLWLNLLALGGIRCAMTWLELEEWLQIRLLRVYRRAER